MTLFLVIACNGRQPSGMRCRSKFTSKELDSSNILADAAEATWTEQNGVHFCPACSRRNRNKM